MARRRFRMLEIKNERETMKKTTSFILLSILITSISFSAWAHLYQKDGELPPIKLTYKDFNKILSSLRSQLTTVSDDKYNRVYEEITVSDGDFTITKEKDFIFSEDDRIPKEATELSYSYRYSEGEITRISITLRERTRNISIKGPSLDSVNAIYALLYNQLSKHKIIIGGQKFRIIGFIVLLVIALVFWLLSYSTEKKSLQITYAILAIAIYLSILSLPFSRWFPGFSIFSDSASFTIRYSAQLSLVGIILTIVFFITSILFSYFLGKKQKI